MVKLCKVDEEEDVVEVWLEVDDEEEVAVVELD